MSSECDFSNPESVLRAFWTAMNGWELDANRSMPRVDDFDAMQQWWPQIAEERQRIVMTFCTPKKRPENERPNVGSPPEYDPAKDRIVETKPLSASKLEIKTEDTTRPGRAFTYLIVKKGDKWFLDAKQFVDWQGQTKKAAL
jgi:hypothetical protein